MRSVATVLVWIALLAWAGLAVKGVLDYLTLEATGSGFTRGSNRISAFLRWEALALGAAVIGSFAGRAGQVAGPTRLAARIPLWLSGGFFTLLIAGFAALIIYARLQG